MGFLCPIDTPSLPMLSLGLSISRDIDPEECSASLQFFPTTTVRAAWRGVISGMHAGLVAGFEELSNLVLE